MTGPTPKISVVVVPELEVLGMLAAMPNQAIATEMVVALDTVK